MTITADRQIEFNGLRLDGRYEIQAIEGLASAPEVRVSDLSLAGRHGLYPGIDLLGGRVVTITVTVWAWTEAEFVDAVKALRAAFQPGGMETPLSFRLPGVGDGTVRINARARRLHLPQTTPYWQQAAAAVIELFATDPRIYSDAESSVTLTLETIGTVGHQWPQTWPMSWGGALLSGSTIVTNEGSFPAEMVLRIDGPVTNPRIENLTTGATIFFGIDLPVGEYLLVDTDARSVLLNGTANRYSTLLAGSTWPTLLPGGNDIRFAAATATAGQLTITSRSAWI